VILLAVANDFNQISEKIVVFGSAGGETYAMPLEEFEEEFYLVKEREDIDVNRSIWPN
jgi:hypothetical protein